MKPFFGFTALYRGEKLFGLLPRTRAMQTANSLVFKLESPTPKFLRACGRILESVPPSW